MPRPAIRIDGLTLAEIAARAGLSNTTVWTRYHAGERALDVLSAPRRPGGAEPRRIDGATIAEHAARIGISAAVLRDRLRKGEPIVSSLSRAKGRHRRRHDAPALDAAILAERLCVGGPIVTQQVIADRFGVRRQTVSQREQSLRRAHRT
jgi:DNA-binding Lrp family transcriptional regulator